MNENLKLASQDEPYLHPVGFIELKTASGELIEASRYSLLNDELLPNMYRGKKIASASPALHKLLLLSSASSPQF